MDELERQKMLRAQEESVAFRDMPRLRTQPWGEIVANLEAEVAALTAERDCYREALGYAYHRLHSLQGHVGEQRWTECPFGDCPTNRDTWALAGTGETPPPTAKWVQDYRRGDDW